MSNEPLDLDHEEQEEQQNQLAATALAHLINFGVATVPPESLPRDWRTAYEAVRSIAASYLVSRRHAFEEAIAASPFHIHMQMEVDDALERIEDRPQDQLRVYSGWETLRQPPTRNWVVEDVLAPSSVNFLIGAPGAKKSWLALDLAVCVANAKPWLGHSTAPSASSSLPVGLRNLNFTENGFTESPAATPSSESSPVLILDAESGLNRLWDRMGRALRGHHAAPQAPLYFIPNANYNFDSLDDTEAVIARAKSLKARLIIIDALANVMPGVDENNVLSMKPILKNLHKLAKDTGAAVLVVHHTNKQGVVRGSSLMVADVDHMLCVESDAQDDLIRLATVKARDLAPLAHTIRSHFDTNESNEPSFHLSLEQTQEVARSLSRTSAQVLKLLDGSSLTFAQLAGHLSDLAPGTVRNVLHELVVTGRVQRADSGSRGRKAHYCLSATPSPSSHIPHPSSLTQPTSTHNDNN